MTTSRPRFSKVATAALWIVPALAAAFILPATAPESWWGRGPLIAVCGHLLRLALAAFFIASSWALGDCVMRAIARIDKPGINPAPADNVRGAKENSTGSALIATRVAVGLACLSIVLFAMAAWGAYTRPVFLVLFAVQAAILFARIERGGEWMCRARRVAARTASSPIALLGIALIALHAMPGFLNALAPPYSWDDQVYHLPLPAAYLEAGRFVSMPWNLYGQQPGGIDLLYGWGLALGDDITAVLLQFGLGATACLLVWEIAVCMGFRRAAWIAPALLLCHHTVVEILGWAYNDFGMGLFLASAWWMAWEWARARGPRHGWLWAGLCAGMVSASKYTGGPLVAAVGVWFLIAGLIHRRRGRRAHSLLGLAGGFAGFATVSVLMLIPWLAKNYVLTGNPFSPLWSDRFPEPIWTPLLSEQLAASQQALYGFGRSWVDWLLLLPRVFIVSDYLPRNFSGALSAVPLGAAIAASLLPTPRRRCCVAPFTAFLLVFFVWGTMNQISRFLLPALPLLALAGLGAIEAIRRSGHPARRWIIAGFLALALLLDQRDWSASQVKFTLEGTVLPRWKQALTSAPMLLGREPLHPFLAARSRSYQAFDYIESLPPDERGRYVAFFFETMGYYADFPYRSGPFHAHLWVEMARNAGSPEAFARRLASDGVQLVLVNHNIYDSWFRVMLEQASPEDFYHDPALFQRYLDGLRIVDEFLKTQTTEVFRASNTAVYRIKL